MPDAALPVATLSGTPLSDPRHEAFAQNRAKGMSAAKAQKLAGLGAGRVLAATLEADVAIAGRIGALHDEAKAAAEAAGGAMSFEAKDLFERLARRIDGAAAAGDHKTAMDGEKFMIACFGYADSPTLTHEHIRGQPLVVVEPQGEAREVPRFGKMLAELRKRAG